MRKIQSLALSVFLAVGFFGLKIASPTPVAAACSGSYVTIYSDSGQVGASRTFCYPAYASSLAAISGPCQFLAANWDNCVSSIRVYVTGTLKACFYEDAVFLNSKLTLDHSESYLYLIHWDGELANPNDAITSFQWYFGSTCPAH